MTKDVVIFLDEETGTEGVSGPAEPGVFREDTGTGKSEAGVFNEDVPETDKLPDHAIVNDDGSVTLRLTYPRTVIRKKSGKPDAKEHFEALTFHRLTGADQRAIAAASPEMMAVVAFARSTRTMQGIMNVLFDVMDLKDINECGQVMNHFLTSGRKIGR